MKKKKKNADKVKDQNINLVKCEKCIFLSTSMGVFFCSLHNMDIKRPGWFCADGEADMAPVTRCYRCTYYRDVLTSADDYPRCALHDRAAVPNGFCSDGRQKGRYSTMPTESEL